MPRHLKNKKEPSVKVELSGDLISLRSQGGVSVTQGRVVASKKKKSLGIRFLRREFFC